ncbi:MAG: ArdC family protein [Syntrophobacteraceae bacterium]
MGEQQDVYTRVTNKIIADLEKGELTWRQPWKAGHAAGPTAKPLRHNGERYRGINVLMLWACSLEKGYGTRSSNQSTAKGYLDAGGGASNLTSHGLIFS